MTVDIILLSAIFLFAFSGFVLLVIDFRYRHDEQTKVKEALKLTVRHGNN